MLGLRSRPCEVGAGSTAAADHSAHQRKVAIIAGCTAAGAVVIALAAAAAFLYCRRRPSPASLSKVGTRHVYNVCATVPRGTFI